MFTLVRHIESRFKEVWGNSVSGPQGLLALFFAPFYLCHSPRTLARVRVHAQTWECVIVTILQSNTKKGFPSKQQPGIDMGSCNSKRGDWESGRYRRNTRGWDLHPMSFRDKFIAIAARIETSYQKHRITCRIAVKDIEFVNTSSMLCVNECEVELLRTRS